MPKKLKEFPLLPLFRRFINEIKKGKHLQKNGKKITKDSINNYLYLERLLKKFSTEKQFALRLKDTSGFGKKQFEDEKQYWKSFYISFTAYLYDDLHHFDNYVGRTIKLLRAFLNYLVIEKNMNIGAFHKKFYAPFEDIDITILSPERLNYLITNKELEAKLEPELKKVKDVFVFGCSVALRFSDLMKINKTNIEVINDRVYVKVQSKKTATYSRVKLTDYAINILNKYSRDYVSRILPPISKNIMNQKIKKLLELYGFTEPIERKRQRRGVPKIVYKDAKTKTVYRFCDAITTHTMRRSAITHLLSSGVSEETVRKISGHSANSKEFYRYVSFSQAYMDAEIDMAHEKLNAKTLEFA